MIVKRAGQAEHDSGAKRDSGVLSGLEIERCVAEGQLIVERSFSRRSLNPASYEVTIAPDGLIEADGTTIEPGYQGHRRTKIVLQPGEAALFSTVELFRMPWHVTGNLTIRNKFASEGLMLLSGMLIDPSFGWHEEDLESGSRLYLNVANIGRESIEIHPGKQRIARVQFLRVCGNIDETETVSPSLWSEQQQPALGFLTELKDLTEDHNALKERVMSTSQMVQYVVFLGFFLLGTTLLGVVLATVLAIHMKS